MNTRKISDSKSLVLELHEALKANENAKYYHKLDLILLVIKGMKVSEVASLYDEPIVTVSYWTKCFLREGFEGLKSGIHTGRPKRLSQEQLLSLEQDLQKSPMDFGYDYTDWDGIVLSKHIEEHYHISLQVRQCQRTMRQLGFTLQRPRMIPDGSNEAVRADFKKN